MPPRLENLLQGRMPELLRETGSPWGSGVGIQVLSSPESVQSEWPDFRVQVSWGDMRLEFLAQAKARGTPKVLDALAREALEQARESDLLPMVVVPYLKDGQLERLAVLGVSGLDLCGNGIITVPGRVLLQRSGQPNRYRDSAPTRFAYRGTTSLVPRVFLCRLAFQSVGEIRQEIAARGCQIALSTVSKALVRMEEDILVERTREGIALLQPEALLDRLVAEFRLPRALRTAALRTQVSLAEFFRLVGKGQNLVLSGASSASFYASGQRSDMPVLYCDNLAEVRKRLGDTWQPTDRFADLAIIETQDKTAFFDVRPDTSGAVAASPIQAYLELSRGDKREQQMAQQIRESLLRDADRKQP